MKTSEIKELSVAEIQERIDAEKENLNRLKLNHTVSPIENSSEIKKNSQRYSTNAHNPASKEL